MGPFFVFEDTPTPRAMPEGWMVKPFGDWDGRSAAVAYDPRRYQVMVAFGVTRADVDGLRGGPTPRAMAFTTAGWVPFSFDYANRRSLWVRDLRTVGLPDPRPSPAVTPIGLER